MRLTFVVCIIYLLAFGLEISVSPPGSEFKYSFMLVERGGYMFRCHHDCKVQLIFIKQGTKILNINEQRILQLALLKMTRVPLMRNTGLWVTFTSRKSIRNVERTTLTPPFSWHRVFSHRRLESRDSVDTQLTKCVSPCLWFSSCTYKSPSQNP